MKDLRACVALVTGASGGLGTHIARGLARSGADVIVTGRREDALAEVASELSGLGVQALAVAADVADPDQLDSLVEQGEAKLGGIDVLVNNAGVEIPSAFTNYTREELTEMVAVNLTAPLLLTQRLLPGMLARGRGHVVFISSVAGKLGTAYQVPYAATKAALVSLAQSLRFEYSSAPVGFSVICPGFITGDGMYQRMIEAGFRSSGRLPETDTTKVTERVLEAIRDDRPEVIELGMPLRPMLAVGQMAPRLLERAVRRGGVTELFRRVAALHGRDS